MKLNIYIDKTRDEEVIIYAHKKNDIVEKIEEIVLGDKFQLIGFMEREAIKLEIDEIYCIITENNKVIALTDNGKFLLKHRMYQLEEKLPQNFIKINQSCIANTKKIKKFSAHFSGTLNVEFKNGYSDYVSRRNIKKIKERLGL